ncbi:MAG: hypothetical protein H7A43_02765 [Verrucomicrobia bacterium]|nr:hypothetical protein [Verrucomicrobiota bacterium]
MLTEDNRMKPSGTIKCLPIALMVVGFPVIGHAQFLRLGPFDFDATTSLEGIYTTNVEEQYPSEQTAEPEDYYFIWSLDLMSSTAFNPNTTVDLNFGTSIEKHLNRPDLDNSENPFGHFNLRVETDLNRYLLYGEVSYERNSDSSDFSNTFFPDTKTKGRKVSSLFEYGAGIDWEYNQFYAGASYEYSEDRYDDAEFQIGDKDTETMEYHFGVQLLSNLSLGYEYETEDTTLVREPPPNTTTKKTQKIAIDWDVKIIERPELTYSFGVEKEDQDGEEGEWEPIHTFRLSDEREIASNLKYDYFASYEIEQTPEADDIAFEFGGGIEHQVSPSLSHRFTARKQPVDTFGSTEDTDETEFEYSLDKRDLIIQGGYLTASATYTIDRPVRGPEERTWEYEVNLGHEAQLTSRLSRTWEYSYTREDSDLVDELLEEHRFTLTLKYDF